MELSYFQGGPNTFDIRNSVRDTIAEQAETFLINKMK